MNNILKAAKLANMLHLGQVRKDGYTPFIYHPARVAGMVSQHPLLGEKHVITAWLHDAIEDVEGAEEAIKKEFGSDMVNNILYVTNVSVYKKISGSREYRKNIDLDAYGKIPQEFKIIKLFDRYDNMRDISGLSKDFLKILISETYDLLDVLGEADKSLSDLIRVNLVNLEEKIQ